MKVLIREAHPRDAAAVALIYQPYIAQTAITFEEAPVSAPDMTDRIATIQKLHPFLVAECSGDLVGYAYAAPHRPRASFRWSVDVAVYLAPTHQRRGVGTKLYQQLLPLLARQGYVMAYAGITIPNPASIGMHESMGFKQIGLYHNVGYKLGAWRNMGWWERQLPATIAAKPAEPIPWGALRDFNPITLEIGESRSSD